MNEINELAIGGGGIKGIAFVGALYQLEKSGLINNLKKISGTSIGAFIAVCLVIGYKPSELMDFLFEYDYSNLKDVDISGFLTRKGLMKGEKIKEFFQQFISKKEDPNITLEKLYEKYNIELIVVATCVNTQSPEYISYKTDPNLDIFTLICMSTAIPGFLPPVQYKNKLYIDGCVFNNLPMCVLSENAWGISSEKEKSPFIPTENINYFTHFTIFLKMMYSGFQKEKITKNKNIIRVKIGKIEVTSFNISKDDKFALIQYGIEAANRILPS